MEDIKYMDIKEFREKGYLQELNRNFLHLLGLALEVKVDEETGEETLGGIWDYRDDPDGIIYNYKESDPKRVENAWKKKHFVLNELKNRTEKRIQTFDFVIEPIKEEIEADFADEAIKEE